MIPEDRVRVKQVDDLRRYILQGFSGAKCLLCQKMENGQHLRQITRQTEVSGQIMVMVIQILTNTLIHNRTTMFLDLDTL